MAAMTDAARRSEAVRDSAARGPATKSRRSALAILGLLLLLLIAAYAAALNGLRPHTPGAETSIDRLQRAARTGQLEEVKFLKEDSRLVAQTDRGPVWAGYLGEIQATALASSFSRAGVATRIDTQSPKRLLALATQIALPIATLVIGFAFLFLLFRSATGGELGLFGRSRARRYIAGDTTRLTFKDVAGLHEAVAELREIKDFLAAPEAFEAVGAKPPRGVLLAGPPGCGKTLLAKAVAGEAAVPFFSISATEFVEMLTGVGAARIRDLFQRARSAAPSIVFIDEIDAIGRERSMGGDGINVEWEASLNELLVQLDGFDEASHVVLMAATNRADMLDSALVRRGRFDRHIVVDLPDLSERVAIFGVHARGKPLAPEVDLEKLARRTAGLSGADIASVVNEGALLAARRRQQTIGVGELEEALDRVLAGPERRSRLRPDEERLRLAYHESGHVIVAWMLNLTSIVEKVSIVARGHSFGSTWHVPKEDSQVRTRSQLQAEIASLLGGRAAEDLVYGEPSSQAQDDLRQATSIAREMVFDLGMSASLGPVLVDSGQEILARSDRAGGSVAEAAEREVVRLLETADGACREVLTAHRDELDRLTHLLLERETLDRGELEAALVGLEAQPALGAR